MKRKYVVYFLTIGIFYVLCIGIVSNNGNAWYNGKLGCAGNRGVLFADYSVPHLTPETSEYYSTHDWIAECALEILFMNYPGHKFVQMLYTNIS